MATLRSAPPALPLRLTRSTSDDTMVLFIDTDAQTGVWFEADCEKAIEIFKRERAS